MRNQQKGFSLIELLIVVAIFLIISAIAIPNFMRSRMRANEVSAVASLRAINTAAVTYSITYPDVNFPATLSALGGPAPCTTSLATSAGACLIDEVLAAGTKSGYNFVWTGDGLVPSVTFTVTATPQVPGSSGQNNYCTDQSGLIRLEPAGTACTSASAPL
ncbi:MAG TPA: type II secretion system protein [Candidatus Cybelea sp.]|nr:type II secretion system protein [Candidatus Cybelea sp.]